MPNLKVSDAVSIGGQPSTDGVIELARQGFRSVLNLRQAGEGEQSLDPVAEGESVRAAGMQYVHIPVALRDLTPETLDQFIRDLEQLPKPVYVHCKGGTRAGTLVAIADAVHAGGSGKDALVRAAALECPCEEEALQRFVEEYVDRRNLDPSRK